MRSRLASKSTPVRLSTLQLFYGGAVGLAGAYVMILLRFHRTPSIPNSQVDALRPLARGTFVKQELSIEQVRNISSVDYMACCGAGHRISKLSDASYVSKKLGFALRSFWGYCDNVEVYDLLFGPQPIEEVVGTHHVDRFVRINNDVPGFSKFTRLDNLSECPYPMEKIEQDIHFYRSHRNRFRAKESVERFRRENFHKNATILGMHVRAGNGEPGDFADRGRAIDEMDSWLRRVVDRLLEHEWGPSVILFLATDTPAIIPKLDEILAHRIPLVHLNQVRPEDGFGVMFGERGKVVTTGEKCERGWMATYMDMILLSHADVVVAARPSSFTQSMPMSLVLAKPKDTRKILASFCEMNPTAMEMRCFEDFRDWCKGSTDFSLGTIKQRYEYLRKPMKEFDSKKFKIQNRPMEGCKPRPEGWKQPCLPYNFSQHEVVPRSRSNRKFHNH
jgi:hypothetical protein